MGNPPDEDVTSDSKTLEEWDSGLISAETAAKVGLSMERLPESSHEGALAERLLSEELSSLSLMEHEKILFDVHGLPQFHDVDPENVDELLSQVDEEIRLIKNKPAYEHAVYLDEDYVVNRSFRLRFLRCDRFDTRLAAERVVQHFRIKKELFGGGEVLARDVLLKDLSKDDMAALESGFLQILPTRDAAGRSMFAGAPMHRPGVPIENLTRAIWYMFNATLQDEETQHKGMVGLFFNVGIYARTEPIEMLKQIHRVRSGIPKRIVGMHYCFDDESFRPFVAGMRLFLDKEARRRFRPHFGDPENIAFELQTYGIPTKDHPVQPNGSLSLEWHQQWLQVRRTQEESESSKNGVLVPRRFDVLFGRGKNTRQHTGNLRAAHLVEMFQEEYERAGKFQKTEIAERIIGIIHDSYGRFLKWDEGGWVEVAPAAAREKISHFFRHLRSRTSGEPSSDKQTPSASLKRVTPCPSPLHPHVEEEPEKNAKHAR